MDERGILDCFDRIYGLSDFQARSKLDLGHALLNDAGRKELATFWAKWQYVSSRIDKLKEGAR